ncbi:hypothetical protein GDO81_027191 [Engystomops pustulosus]|uniref:Uncharacterized protein n=1 Tax=Engystomops pustulosus TaxID=76066 RepID=A0AAV6Z4A7_ENGPU|nr:hypothetical protein GDO81_027191 [Engystomops pustulosus]
MHVTEIRGLGRTITRRIRRHFFKKSVAGHALTFIQDGSVNSSAFRCSSAQQQHLVDAGGTALVNHRKTRIHRRERTAGSRMDRVSKCAP